MSNPLYDVPGLGGYLAAVDRNQAQGMQGLQQASTVLTLQDAMQKQAREQAYRSEVAGARDDASRMAVAAKYASPDKLIDVQQRGIDRKTQLEQSAIQFAQQMDLRRETLEQNRDLALSRAADKAAQDAINNEFKQRQLVLDEQNKHFQQYLAQQGLDIKKLMAGREKPLTEFQGKSALYGSRAATSDRTLNQLEETISLTGLATKESLQNTPVIGGVLGAAANKVLSADQQKVEQAQRDFVNAVLRQESGAVISQPEFDNAKKQYFPQPGDSKEVIAQKKANRQLAIAGFRRMSGPAWADVEEQLKHSSIPVSGAAPVGGAVPPPPPGFQINR